MNYKVLGKYINGVEITGYGLLDEEGNGLKVKLDDFIMMVKNGLVDDFKHMVVEGENYAIPKNGLESQVKVLNSHQFEIKDRIFNDEGLLVGYVVESDADKELKLSLSKVWDLAFEGLVSNAGAYYKEEDNVIKRLIIAE